MTMVCIIEYFKVGAYVMGLVKDSLISKVEGCFEILSFAQGNRESKVATCNSQLVSYSQELVALLHCCDGILFHNVAYSKFTT